MVRDIKNDVLEAAVAIFSRYGFHKSTMNDIAEEAKVARQTLYNLYPNKAAVINATALYFTDEAIKSINAAINPNMSLADKLKTFSDNYVVRGYEITQKSPDAQDLVSGNIPIEEDIKSEMGNKFRALFIQILEPYQEKIDQLDLKIDDLADSIYVALASSKYMVRDLDHLKQTQNNLISMISSQLEVG